jgi:hypothetical protein
MRRRQRFPWPATITLATVLLAVGACTGDGGSTSGSGAGSPAATAPATAPAAPTPGAAATTFPIPGSPQPQAVPVLKTVTGLGWNLSLNRVSRVSADSVLVEATLRPTTSGQVFRQFEEPGFLLRQNEETGKLDNTYEFSAVTLTTQGDPKQYLPLRDETGRCACTNGFLVSLDPAQTLPVYVYMSAPAADTVNVTVRGFPSFSGVRVQQ